MLYNFNKINFTSLKIQGGHNYKCNVPDRKKSGNTPDSEVSVHSSLLANRGHGINQ